MRSLLENTGWMIGDQVVRLAIGLFVGIWVARYLGPAQLGLLSLVAAVMSVAVTVSILGIDAILVKELVAAPGQRDRLLGTAAALRAGAGFVSGVLPLAAMVLLRDGNELALKLVLVSVVALPFQAFGTIEFWFQSEGKVRAIVVAKNVITLGMAGVRILLLVEQAPIEAFVWASTVEGIFTAAALCGAYRLAGGRLRSWTFDTGLARRLAAEGMPIMLSGLAIFVYIKADQLMVGYLLDDHALGIYSVGVRLSEIWYFIPTAITAAVFPVIAARDKDGGDAAFRVLFDALYIAGIALALPLTLFAGPLVELLYGTAFAASAGVLAVHIWGTVFVFLGVASGRWLILRGLGRFMLYRTLAGAAFNVALNLVLIPRYGPIGAAWATLVSQIVAAYLFDMTHPQVRPLFRMKTQTIFLAGQSFRRVLFGEAGR